MPQQNVFVDQAEDGVFNLTYNGQPVAITQFEVNLAGPLGAATLTTQVRHANAALDAWIAVADGTFTPSDSPAYTGAGGSGMAFISGHFVRFVLSGSDGGTSLSLTASW